MTIPILADGEKRGTLTVFPEGPYTVFEARCAPLGGLRRLYVFGGGKRACLGVLAPEGGELTLRRKLSRAAMKDFPEPIESAAPEENAPDEAPREKSAPPVEKHNAAAHEKRMQTQEEHNAAAYEKWTERPGGSLLGTERGTTLLALPCALRRAPPGADLREIGGKRYLVFRT